MLLLQEKRMKTHLNLILFAFIHFASQSQNLYLTASSGYNWGTNRSNFENYTYNKWVSVVYPYDKDRTTYSLGKGMDFNIGIGYTTRHKIGFELAGSYMHGFKTIAESQYVDTIDDVFRKEIYGRFYKINPSLHFVSELKSISFKMSLGATVGFGKMYLNQEGVYQGKSWVRYENEFSGGTYFGLRAGLAVSYTIGKRMHFFADMNWTNAYYSPAKGEVVKFMTGDENNTDVLKPWEREVIYTNSIEGPPYDPNQPLKRLKERFSASSIGLQVGIQWDLWTKKQEEDKKD